MLISRWSEANKAFLSSAPHPSALPYELHRAVLLSLSSPADAIAYAGRHLMVYMPTQPVTQLITSCLYPASHASQAGAVDILPTSASAGGDVDMDNTDPSENKSEELPAVQPYTDLRAPAPLAKMFEAEFCRRHGLPKEDLLSIAIDLGGRGGALAAIEKARKVMLLGDRMGNVREWDELPVCFFSASLAVTFRVLCIQLVEGAARRVFM